jgi:uncharacterized protein (TIGR03083 family)
MTTFEPDAPSDAHLQPVVAAELVRLADALEPLPADAWDAPSRCERWRVREVVAHLTMAARYGPDEFLGELEADGYDFGKLSDRIAARDGALAPESLLADLRSETLAAWAPPGGGFAGALTHVVVHGLDVTEPLGLGRVASDEATRLVLDGLTVTGGHAHFGAVPVAATLRATDLDWSFGSGNVVDAPAHVIVLALCGRAVPGGDAVVGSSSTPA